jgi:hypothetical protein
VFAKAARVVVPELLTFLSEIRARARHRFGVDRMAFFNLGVEACSGLRGRADRKVIMLIPASAEIIK